MFNAPERPCDTGENSRKRGMVQLLLILCGSRVVRRNWWMLFFFGIFWMGIGAFIFSNALFSKTRISPIWFTIPLLIDSALSLAAAFAVGGTARSLRLSKAGTLLCVSLLIIFAPRYSGVIIGILVGLFLMIDAAWRAGSAWVLLYQGWRRTLCFAVVEFLAGVWSIVPWPTHWAGSVGADAGTLLMLSAAGMCGMGLRLRRLPEGMSILNAMNRAWTRSPDKRPLPGYTVTPRLDREPWDVTVHVWTPTEQLASINQGVSRYVAARDRKGVISTGHAALELPPDVYISHYPAVEIDRDQSEFRKTLRSTADNDVDGTFMPSYPEESAGWCPSTMQVRLSGLNTAAIRHFWSLYRADTTYNLTNRNCSSAVAHALDVGLEGFLERHAHPSGFWLRLLFTPECWVAGFMRQRAAAMTWTPGLVLDYARAISYILTLSHRLRKGRAGG